MGTSKLKVYIIISICFKTGYSSLFVENKDFHQVSNSLTNRLYESVYEQTNNFGTTAVPTNCSEELENISKKISSFSICAIKNSRPIEICKNCVQQINDTINVYTDLKEKPELETCRQLFFESDKLSIVDVLYNNMITLWTNSYCDSCYTDKSLNTNYSSFSEETEKFFAALVNFNDCMPSTNKTEISNNTCVQCFSQYSALNKVYQAIVHQNKDSGVCMDVFDAMNITRHIWYNQYHCVHFDTSIGAPNIVTALLIGSLPFFFYLLSRNIAIIEDIKLVQPKRKSSTRYAVSQ